MPLRFRMEDLSPAQQEQVKRQLSPQKRNLTAPAPQKPHKDCPVITDSPVTHVCVCANDNIQSCDNNYNNNILSHTRTREENPPAVELRDFNPPEFTKPSQRNLRSEKMSSTEKAYLRDVLHGNGWFEPITLKSPSGNRYTPDFLTFVDGTPTLVETKGAYRLQSEGRAHTAFLEAASNFSSIFRFLWVKREKGGKWSQKLVIPVSSPTSPSTTTTTTSTTSTNT